jgi:hypothetical protein
LNRELNQKVGDKISAMSLLISEARLIQWKMILPSDRTCLMILMLLGENDTSLGFTAGDVDEWHWWSVLVRLYRVVHDGGGRTFAV